MRADTLIRYATARFSQHEEEVGYRYYATEVIRLQAEGRTWGMSYLQYMDYEPPEERDVDEIVADVVARAGLEVIDEPA